MIILCFRRNRFLLRSKAGRSQTGWIPAAGGSLQVRVGNVNKLLGYDVTHDVTIFAGGKQRRSWCRTTSGTTRTITKTRFRWRSCHSAKTTSSAFRANSHKNSETWANCALYNASHNPYTSSTRTPAKVSYVTSLHVMLIICDLYTFYKGQPFSCHLGFSFRTSGKRVLARTLCNSVRTETAGRVRCHGYWAGGRQRATSRGWTCADLKQSKHHHLKTLYNVPCLPL